MGILPLFPELTLLDAHVDGSEIIFTLKNNGAFTIQTRTYGEPEYRLIAKLFDGDTQIDDRWLSLPRDLPPGEVATLHLAVRHLPPSNVLRLYHALQDIPMLEPEPFAEVRDVR